MLGLFSLALLVANAAERTKLWYRHTVSRIPYPLLGLRHLLGDVVFGQRGVRFDVHSVSRDSRESQHKGGTSRGPDPFNRRLGLGTLRRPYCGGESRITYCGRWVPIDRRLWHQGSRPLVPL